MSSEAYQRFISSMTLDFDAWHDGTGYDLEALGQLDEEEREEVVRILIARKDVDWRDVEALAYLDTDTAREAVEICLDSPNSEVRLKASRAMLESGRLSNPDEILVPMLRLEGQGNNFSRAWDLAAEHPSEAVKQALLYGAKRHGNAEGVHCAALLFYFAGIAKEAFDWDHRPFFLRFAEAGPDRDAAYAELCERIGLEGE